jgi:hypothetical protein
MKISRISPLTTLNKMAYKNRGVPGQKEINIVLMGRRETLLGPLSIPIQTP